jgi:hypothetical protein
MLIYIRLSWLDWLEIDTSFLLLYTSDTQLRSAYLERSCPGIYSTW